MGIRNWIATILTGAVIGGSTGCPPVDPRIAPVPVIPSEGTRVIPNPAATPPGGKDPDEEEPEAEKRFSDLGHGSKYYPETGTLKLSSYTAGNPYPPGDPRSSAEEVVGVKITRKNEEDTVEYGLLIGGKIRKDTVNCLGKIKTLSLEEKGRTALVPEALQNMPVFAHGLDELTLAHHNFIYASPEIDHLILKNGARAMINHFDFNIPGVKERLQKAKQYLGNTELGTAQVEVNGKNLTVHEVTLPSGARITAIKGSISFSAGLIYLNRKESCPKQSCRFNSDQNQVEQQKQENSFKSAKNKAESSIDTLLKPHKTKQRQTSSLTPESGKTNWVYKTAEQPADHDAGRNRG